MQKKPWVLGLIAVGLVLAATSAAFVLNPSAWFAQDAALVAGVAKDLHPAPVPGPTPAQVAPLPAGATPNYRAIVQQAAPAVVGVTVAGTHKLTEQEIPFDPDDPFFQFFRGLPGFQFPLPRRGDDVPFRSEGSGFIISSDGLILTNAHVVREAKEVTVKLNDRREFRAKVLGADPKSDIAVLRIDAKNLPVVLLGDAQQLQVGDPVLAIGSPFGFEQSATQGIVSAKGRSLPGDTAVPFIQTDAAVNPGNSGGPLFDGSGAVVGINAQIYSRSGGFQGLSFAIPINVALKVKDQIVRTGKVSHARLGVTVQEIDQSLAESFGLARPEGALIAQVHSGSAAAAAGLKAGDVVMEVSGEPVVRSGDLSSRIGLASPGDTVRLKIWRDKAALEVTAKLGRAEDGDKARSAGGDEGSRGQLGLTLRPLTREERSRLHLEAGLVVESVTGAAARAGLAPGDVLLAINGQPVTSVDQVRSVMDKKPKRVALLIDRKGARIFVAVDVGS
jgi:serine protease Do